MCKSPALLASCLAPVLDSCPHVCLCGSDSNRRLPRPAFIAVLFCIKSSTCLPISLNLILASSGFFFLLLALHDMKYECLSLNISNTDFSLPFGSDSELKCSFKSVYLPFSVISLLSFCLRCSARLLLCALTEIQGCALIS